MMAHIPQVYREMGVLVAHGKEFNLTELLRHYEELFMKGLTLQAIVKKNTNVLHHIMGYFKHELTPAEKSELLEIIEQYRSHLLTLLKHYVSKYDKQYLAGQVYLSPHPSQLMLRNHV